VSFIPTPLSSITTVWGGKDEKTWETEMAGFCGHLENNGNVQIKRQKKGGFLNPRVT
jgi:hypothetical protein